MKGKAGPYVPVDCLLYIPYLCYLIIPDPKLGFALGDRVCVALLFISVYKVCCPLYSYWSEASTGVMFHGKLHKSI